MRGRVPVNDFFPLSGTKSSRAVAATALSALAALALAAPANADFPYARPGADTTDYTDLFTDPGQTPADLEDKETWMYAATAEDPGSPPDPAKEAVIASPAELHGVRGAHIVDADASVDTAWQRTTGRPDVAIAVLDSGIKWDDDGAMANVRFKIRLNRDELPKPANDGLASPNEPGEDCSPGGPYAGAGYDLNRDGVFNLRDYSCDARTPPNPPLNVNSDLFEPQDLLLAFSDGRDRGRNGYVDDIAGWDFLDDDNDPYDDVQYGHGSGEIQDSTAEADNGESGAGTCPNCMSVPLRVGDSFIADASRFAAAVTYATDNRVLVVQEALGSLDNTGLSREAVDYAYRHGVTVIASAADESAQHNNWPSSLPHVVMVNSVTMYDDAEEPPSYLKFNGCTNFYAKLTVAIPSVSCSSDATGRGSGIAGLIYSAALDAIQTGRLEPHPSCRLVGGGRCPISANEVRQLIASGTVDGAQLADDVDFSQAPEPSCTIAPLSSCSDPFLGRGVEDATLLPVVSPIATSKRYPARAGHDQFYGYGRANVASTTAALLPEAGDSIVPPEVEITSPEWYSQNDPAQPTLAVGGQVWARGGDYSCRVYVAPGHYPNNATTTDPAPGDFEQVDSPVCDGSTRSSPIDGELARIDLAELESRFPPSAGDFTGREPGAPPAEQTSFGRPNTAPYGFVVEVLATTPAAGGAPATTGEDRRAMYLHRDVDMLAGFPRKLVSDGESSPALADLDGDNRNELVVASADGVVHAYRYEPTSGAVSELPGWPVRDDVPGFVAAHTRSPAYASGAVEDHPGGAIIAALAVGDADRDGVPEVYAADFEGKIYGWSPAGERVFEAEANPAYSGKPLAPFENVRHGHRNRTQHGFLGSPVLADLDRNDGGRLEIVAAGMDRHVYAWEANGTPVPGFPVLVVDQAKVSSVDPATHAVDFDEAAAGPELDQGAIVDTPALADIAGDPRPEIIIGTNEEYAVDEGNEGPFNVAPSTAPSLGLLGATGLLDFANGRLYAIKPGGDPDAPAAGQSAFVDGWPVPIGIALSELLPVVGEGINGSPVVAPVSCASGGGGPKIGTMPAAGPAYVLNADGSSCLGSDPGDSRYRTLSDGSDNEGNGQVDHPVLPAVGLPAFGAIGGAQPAFVAPAAGIVRALDLGLNEYQTGGQDFAAAWNPTTGQMVSGFPTPVNDLSFLTGPAVGDVGGLPGEEIVAGTSSMDLVALGVGGEPTSPAWPKLTTDWTIATPLLGSLGTLDTEADARRVVVNLTRSGYINAYSTGAGPCDPASSPRFHHDNANSGDYDRDATLPGRPLDKAADDGQISFSAPGDDLLCGVADRYEIVTSPTPITPKSFDTAQHLGGVPDPAQPGTAQTYSLPAGVARYVAVRAIDEQGNVGRPAVLDLGPDGGDGGGASGGGGGGGGADAGGGAGNSALACSNRISGSAAKDRLSGTNGSDSIFGAGGGDRIRGRRGDDCLAGQGGDDRVRGGAGSDQLEGGRGHDRLEGGPGADVIRARRGGRDRINCGPGQDTVYLSRHKDRARNCETRRR